MATFTFNGDTADRLMRDLNEGHIVRLTKVNGSAIVLRNSNDIDELGAFIYHCTIEPSDHEPIIKNIPVRQEGIINFLFGEEFTTYGIDEK